MERAGVGLPETPPVTEAPLPRLTQNEELAIEALIGAWGAQETQKQKRDDVLEWRREGRPGAWIIAELRNELEDE